MKTSHQTASVVLLAIGALVPTCLNAQNRIPAEPVAVLTAYPEVVQADTKPTLTWDIFHPNTVGDVARIIPPGGLAATSRIYVSVQPIGTGIAGQNQVSYPAEVRISLKGGSYQQLFYGTQADVEPQYSLYVKRLSTNDTIDLGGRYIVNGSWTPFYTTRSANAQVISLVKGSVPPPNLPGPSSNRLATYLKPYIDSTGKVNIGPMSVLVLMELSETNRSAPGFDYQDMALLVTFSAKHPNNGHGNNLDGVDSSNPGNGSGGPNGTVDPSGGIDDER